MKWTMLCACFLTVIATGSAFGADKPKEEPEKGTVHFKPNDDQKNVPERYRLEEHKFDYALARAKELPHNETTVYSLTFPSPVKSDVEENNTVHAEYYRPKGKGPFGCVVILDITAGGQKISQTIATHLSQSGVAALYVQMAYYGPRRPANCDRRLLSTNYKVSLEAVRQTVLDLRRAAAWMEARPELDPKRLGVLGTSLGSFMEALACEMEPKLGRLAVLLGGGGLVDAYYDDPRAASIKETWEAFGGTKDKLKELLAPVDPITCAGNLKDRKVLILAAKQDDIVPPKMAEALWKASGEQKIKWYDCTHYGAALFLPAALKDITQHFKEG